MAGGALMVSDKVEAYRDDANLEGMKRSAPVLFTVPGQLYDYGQRRPSDRSAAKRGGEAVWWLQEIDRSFDHWCVLARFNWRRKDLGWRRPGAPAVDVNFADLGLDPERNYLVFEFWSQTFLGSLKGSFTAVAQDPGRGVDVFAIREARPHPWVIGTTRHLSQGGVSLMEVNWEERGKTLSGTSSVVVGDPYVLTVHVPDGFELKRAEIDGEKAETTRRTEMATIRFVPTETKTVKWKLAFGG